MPYSLTENVKFETCFDVKTLIPVYFVKAFMLTFDIIKLIVTKLAFFLVLRSMKQRLNFVTVLTPMERK